MEVLEHGPGHLVRFLPLDRRVRPGFPLEDPLHDVSVVLARLRLHFEDLIRFAREVLELVAEDDQASEDGGPLDSVGGEPRLRKLVNFLLEGVDELSEGFGVGSNLCQLLLDRV